MRIAVSLLLNRCAFFAIAALGYLLAIIPRRRRYIVFLGHQGHYNGNAKYLFEAYLKEAEDGLEPIFVARNHADISEPLTQAHILHLRSSSSYFSFIAFLWKAKIMFVTTPGYDWKSRHLFAWRAKTILLSNGIPLKAPGQIAKHFGALKKQKYLSYWKDIDQLWVSSTFERYLASASLSVPIEKIKVNGAARQSQLSETATRQNRETARDKINAVLGQEYVGKRLVLLALTQRAYQEGNKATALDSLSKLDGYERSELVQFLEENNIGLIVRDHFLTNGQHEHELNSHCAYMGANVLPELNDVIAGIDVILTDYSGLYLDFVGQDIPIGLLRFPGDNFLEQRGLILPDEFLTAGMGVSTQEALFSLIKNTKIEADTRARRDMLQRLFFEVEPEACLQNNLSELRALIEG
ncbi:CDP-glycerol glycerophosphotransferase family protein [Shimia sp. R9_3]|uniref:CDP-glycerol glycerophosphotransferase family protein n=1 Tax=Shimia sp. R9_3 TaxID=2821113 RepID=UPI001ADBE587|nr:CDP-glycerol glycerophosphotransferase family protein [Shimia sp. R9_3]MBO9399403.1 CDP-glycerol glycerophosphotransferase family protein [Shimia sp. R9_3]